MFLKLLPAEDFLPMLKKAQLNCLTLYLTYFLGFIAQTGDPTGTGYGMYACHNQNIHTIDEESCAKVNISIS